MRGLALFLLFAVATSQLLKFVPGRELAYNVVGSVDSRGQQPSGTRSTGSSGSLTGILAAKCLQANASTALFIMNMFNVQVDVAQNMASETRRATDGDTPMGYDMYFYQNADGSIPEVIYESDDSPFYVQVKLAAINTFQTSLTSGLVQMTDPTGVHSAAFALQQLTINSTFGASSYKSFMDPNVNAGNVQLTARAQVTFHPTDGSIVSAENHQHVVVVTSQPGAAASLDDDNSGYSMFMSSVGELQVTIAPGQPMRFANQHLINSSHPMTGSMVDVARAQHKTIMEEKAAEIARDLPKMLRTMQSQLHRILPHACSEVVQKAVKRIASKKLSMSNAVVRHRLSRVVAAALRCHAPAKLPSAPAQARAGPSLPFNRSGSASATLGGKAIGVTFDASFLVGTNLNCKNPAFAYEATADVQANLWLFGETTQAFDANFVYGQDGGQPLGDALTLSAFGKVVWQEKLPALQYCKQETLPIGAVQRGLSASHTVWVSIVPVTFTAAADVDLSLSWFWNICSNDLSASIGITPASQFSFTGGAEVDLLVLRAGIVLDASFSSSLVPSANVQGTQCDADVQLQFDSTSDSGYLQGYYAWRHCKYWIFDCTWGTHHQTNFWQHTGTPGQKTLFEKEWNIA